MRAKRFFLVGMAFCVASAASVVYSETYSDLIKQEQEEFSRELMSDSLEFYQEQQRDFQEFRDERDRDFAEFLKAQWERVDFEEPESIIEKPKPLTMPVAKLPPAGKRIEPKPVAATIPPEKVVKVKPAPAYVAPVTPQPQPAQPRPAVKGRPVAFDFFGAAVTMKYDPKMNAGLTYPIDNNSISDFWANMGRSDFETLLAQAAEYRDRFGLNDWGYYVFLDGLGDAIVGNKSNEKNLFVWFMLTKSGYETKVGYRQDTIFLFMPATTNLYGVSFYTLNGKRYYALSTANSGGRLGKIMTYKGKYPGSERNMDFLLRKYPKIAGKMITRDLSFYDGGKKHTITVALNKNSIPFFEYHPQTDVSLYAMAPLPEWIGSTLLTGLKPLLQGKSEQQQVNLLLHFTQTTFRYKTDDQQFGREKVMFPEETVFYPYSDCEDRSIFFSYLVRNLLGLDVVLLSYPNHIATAVRLQGKQVGDQVVIGNQAYTICDPTYINAVLGMAMPQFKGVKPQVVII